MALSLLVYLSMKEDGNAPTDRNRDKAMKIALSVWKGCISTVFDTADQLLVLEIDGKNGWKRTTVRLHPADIAEWANQIKEMQIEVLICGAISRPLETSLTSLGIRVYGFVRGPVEEVFAGYQKGKMDHAVFAMPGCRGRGCMGSLRQNRRRRGFAG